MANVDNPSGFTWVKTRGSNAPIIDYITLAGTVAVGDTLVFSAGTCTIGLSNSSLIHGVAGQAGVSADNILFYPAVPENIFEAQCEGTYATASCLNVAVDVIGATGAQEVDENAVVEKVFMITELAPNSAVGANARVRGFFVRSSYTGLEDAEA